MIGKLIGKVLAETVLLPVTIAKEAGEAAEQSVKTAEKKLG